MIKRFAVLGVALLAVSLAAGLWMADTASAGSVHLEGKGVLYARGAGLAELSGDGRVNIRGHGVGTVLVTGAEVLRARGEGRRIDLPGDKVLFVGWKGKIFVAGEDITVKMQGGKIEFLAAGKGEAFLRGRGIYRVGHHWGTWSEEGVPIRYAQ